jgi:hypothetical protein
MTSLFDSGIRPIIDNHILELSKELRDYGDYWSASSAGYCMRLVIMRRLGIPKSPEMADKDAITQRIFSSGHIFHSWIQAITKQAGLSIAQELELQDEDLMIRGHFDDLVYIKEYHGDHDYDDHLILYDYKTAHSKWFEYAKGRPMSHYNKMQLGTYMYMLRQPSIKQILRDGTINIFLPDWELTESRILKISKDDLRLHEQQLMWSTELESEVLNYWNTLNSYWNNKKLPECSCAAQEGGFMAKRTKAGKAYNDYFYNEQPCSLDWAKHISNY